MVSISARAEVMVLSPLKIVGHCLKALLVVSTDGAALAALTDDPEKERFTSRRRVAQIGKSTIEGMSG